MLFQEIVLREIYKYCFRKNVFFHSLIFWWVGQVMLRIICLVYFGLVILIKFLKFWFSLVNQNEKKFENPHNISCEKQSNNLNVNLGKYEFAN